MHLLPEKRFYQTTKPSSKLQGEGSTYTQNSKVLEISGILTISMNESFSRNWVSKLSKEFVLILDKISLGCICLFSNKYLVKKSVLSVRRKRANASRAVFVIKLFMKYWKVAWTTRSLLSECSNLFGKTISELLKLFNWQYHFYECLWWSTCVLIYFIWLLDHVIYLKLRREYL